MHGFWGNAHKNKDLATMYRVLEDISRIQRKGELLRGIIDDDDN
jgi:hypothetical protein